MDALMTEAGRKPVVRFEAAAGVLKGIYPTAIQIVVQGATRTRSMAIVNIDRAVSQFIPLDNAWDWESGVWFGDSRHGTGFMDFNITAPLGDPNWRDALVAQAVREPIESIAAAQERGERPEPAWAAQVDAAFDRRVAEAKPKRQRAKPDSVEFMLRSLAGRIARGEVVVTNNQSFSDRRGYGAVDITWTER